MELLPVIFKIVLVVSTTIALGLYRGISRKVPLMFINTDEAFFCIGTMMTFILMPATFACLSYLGHKMDKLHEAGVALLGFIFLLADGIILAIRYDEVKGFLSPRVSREKEDIPWLLGTILGLENHTSRLGNQQGQSTKDAYLACEVFTFISCGVCLVEALLALYKHANRRRR